LTNFSQASAASHELNILLYCLPTHAITTPVGAQYDEVLHKSRRWASQAS